MGRGVPVAVAVSPPFGGLAIGHALERRGYQESPRRNYNQPLRYAPAKNSHVNIPPRLTSQLIDFQGFAHVVSATGESGGSAESLFHKSVLLLNGQDRTKTRIGK